MKLTTRLKLRRKSEWWVLQGGSVRTTVGEILKEPADDLTIQYRPYLHILQPRKDGEAYSWRPLAVAASLSGAVEAIRAELEGSVEVGSSSGNQGDEK
jgi:hypothetical protein